MKTQIKYLISGRKDVIIDETNAKYDNANKSTGLQEQTKKNAQK